jgi:hypothetical protein
VESGREIPLASIWLKQNEAGSSIAVQCTVRPLTGSFFSGLVVKWSPGVNDGDIEARRGGLSSRFGAKHMGDQYRRQ